MYDRFSGFIKFRSSERNIENKMSNSYFNEESDSFAPPFSTVERIFTLQLPIYYMQCLNRKFRWVQMRALQKRNERNRLSLFREVEAMLFASGHLPDY